MTTDTADKPEPCHLVYSEIIHNRHGSPAHELRKPGFSVLLDLDRLDEADRISRFFSVNKFNLISFHESDFGPNHKSQRTKTGSLISLSAYIRSLAEDYFDPAQIKKIEMLAFPRILGMSFNPITIYRCLDHNNKDCFRVYEVHNTFGDSHSYASVISTETDAVPLHNVHKMMHVSPFFDVDGYYQLAIRRSETALKLLVRYCQGKTTLLTATLTGEIVPLTTARLLKSVTLSGHFPMRPLVSIHYEAVKLFLKGVRFYKRPLPPEHSVSQTVRDVQR